MFRTRKLGSILLIALPLLNVCLWLIFPPIADVARADHERRYYGEILGSTMMILMALTLLLATRLRFLEPLFNGLDKMYRAHRYTGMLAFGLLLLHFIVIPFAPGDTPPGRAPGYIAFGGFVLLVLLTLAPRLPGVRRIIRIGYRHWRMSHKFIGIFFIMGTAHMFLVDSLVQTTLMPFVLLMFAIAVGIASYLYTVSIARFARRTAKYEVWQVNRLNRKVAEVVLKPVKKQIRFTAGQFLFVRFKGNRILSEPHPFTISSAPGEANLRLTVSASGDFTQYLYDNLQAGTRAIVEGCYGMMDYRQGGNEQIWIAGGIGVTPFLSWMRDMPQQFDRRIDFYYTVKNREEALFLTEILETATRMKSFRVHIHCSADQGRLTMEQIINSTDGSIDQKHIYMCGPSAMLVAFQREFRRQGVPAGRIHYEEFAFR